MNKLYITIFLPILFVNGCCGSYSGVSPERENEQQRKLGMVMSDKKSRIYSDDFVMKHDISVTQWFAKQSFAMSVISLDEQGKVRNQSFQEFSKLDTKAEQVLAFQGVAVEDFIESYHGPDKKEILAKWLSTQVEAKEVLREFLKSIQMEPKHVSMVGNHDSEYAQVIKAQENYISNLEEYEQMWEGRK